MTGSRLARNSFSPGGAAGAPLDAIFRVLSCRRPVPTQPRAARRPEIGDRRPAARDSVVVGCLLLLIVVVVDCCWLIVVVGCCCWLFVVVVVVVVGWLLLFVVVVCLLLLLFLVVCLLLFVCLLLLVVFLLLIAFRPSDMLSVSQGRVCAENFTCCHTEVEVADPTCYLNRSQYTDTWPTSPSTDPITPGAWQGNHRSVNFKVTGMTHRQV